MSDRTFKLAWSNPDLDIHPDPVEGWHRVAVVGLWQDAKRIRRDWPEAAVCGPLRTLRGIDLLVRGLLAAPQIRVLVVVGRDLTPGEGVRKALLSLWQERVEAPAAWNAWPSDLPPDEVRRVLDTVKLATPDTLRLDPTSQGLSLRVTLAPPDGWGQTFTDDRPGGAIILPPSEPTPSDDLPPGLPGQRVTGKTLADVWPRVLAEVMRFGRVVRGEKDSTKELLDLVSVIEDPKESLKEIKSARSRRDNTLILNEYSKLDGTDKHPVLGISQAELDHYYTASFMAETPPEGTEYGYGSRLHGWSEHPIQHADQLVAIRQLLTDNPGTRAAYLTPWRPDEDAGKESGRPCLVGAWFRTTLNPCCVCGTGPCRDTVALDSPCPMVNDDVWRAAGKPPPDTLHLTVLFRSHDVHGAYPLNLAACCRWLVEEAGAQGMAVGTLTCVSMSAHVYDRDWDAARSIAEQHGKPKWSQDPRSAWRVWREGVVKPQPDASDPWAVLAAWRDSNAQPWLRCGAWVSEHVSADVQGGAIRHYGTLDLGDRGILINGVFRTLTPEQKQNLDVWVAEKAATIPPVPTRTTGYIYHAEATDPEGSRVLVLLQAPTKERLLRDIQATGLVTDINHALWLGAEIGKL